MSVSRRCQRRSRRSAGRPASLRHSRRSEAGNLLWNPQGAPILLDRYESRADAPVLDRTRVGCPSKIDAPVARAITALLKVASARAIPSVSPQTRPPLRVEGLGLLDGLAAVQVAPGDEMRMLVGNRALYVRGIGFVEATLITSCLPAPATRDPRASAVAGDPGIVMRAPENRRLPETKNGRHSGARETVRT